MQNKPNVRFQIYTTTYDGTTYGVTYLALASNEKFEGYLVDTYGRVEGRSAAPNAQQDRTATHRIYVQRNPRYVESGNTYTDLIATYFREGMVIKITEMKNPITGFWETYGAPEEDTGIYQIGYVNNLDGFNRNLCGFLKEYAKDY